jgi:tetratricopeptide (TPR) repeat protein
MTSGRPHFLSRFAVSLLLLVAFNVSVAHAQQATEPALDHTRSSIPVNPPNAESGTIRVFDNALLDRLFASDRPAARSEASKRDEAAVNQTTEKKPDPPLLLPDGSFAAKITSRTPFTLAAALRFAEQGRKEIKTQRYHKAVNYFERAVSLGVRNYLPYLYYYLAQTHYHLANYQSAYNFLEVAESWLGDDSDWMSSIAALRQQNTDAMGYAQASSGSRSR